MKRAERYMARLDSLASTLSTNEEETTFDTWASHYLSYDESRRPEVPDRSTPRDAPLYAQGYLDERFELQPSRPALFRRTKTFGSSAGTTTRADTSPSTSPATPPTCPQEPSSAWPTGETLTPQRQN